MDDNKELDDLKAENKQLKAELIELQMRLDRVKPLTNSLMATVSQSHEMVWDYLPKGQRVELAKITKNIADTEAAINRVVCPEQMTAYAA